MFSTLLIAICFSLGFFVESIVGFGGGIIAYSILAFFLDLKEMVLIGLYIGTCASAYICYTDIKSFDKKIFKSLIPASLIGTMLGVLIFSKFSSENLALGLGFLLILLSIKILFFDKFIFPKVLKTKLIFLGGLAQGAFGTGGPFWVNAVVKDFKTKSSLRTTMAVTFVSFNLIRILQLLAQGQIRSDFFTQIWWVIIPVSISIYAGYRVHLKVSENVVKKMIACLTVATGIKLFSKAFI